MIWLVLGATLALISWACIEWDRPKLEAQLARDRADKLKTMSLMGGQAWKAYPGFSFLDGHTLGLDLVYFVGIQRNDKICLRSFPEEFRTMPDVVQKCFDRQETVPVDLSEVPVGFWDGVTCDALVSLGDNI